jgi:hypothetical protein
MEEKSMLKELKGKRIKILAWLGGGVAFKILCGCL